MHQRPGSTIARGGRLLLILREREREGRRECRKQAYGGLVSDRVERVIFEAPAKAQQAWFVRRFGADVNLGNLAPDDVLAVETLRLGLRADTAVRP